MGLRRLRGPAQRRHSQGACGLERLARWLPHGEPPDELSAHVDRLIRRLCELRGNVALFSHGQLGAALAARWIGLPLIAGQHFALHPASIGILGHEPTHPGRRMIELWNETATLERGH